MSKEERTDKKVYNYRTALEQPIWVQKITERWSLPNAVKLSTIGWTILIYLLLIYVVLKCFKGLPIPFPFWAVFLAIPSWGAGIVLADLKIEEQPIGRFARDYLKMYRKYGYKRHDHYLNDGIFFKKPSVIIKRNERRNVGINIKQ